MIARSISSLLILLLFWPNVSREAIATLYFIPHDYPRPWAETVIKTSHFENEIVRPTLEKLAEFDARLNSEPAVTLMLGTAAQESDFGYYLRQDPSGPGKGWWSVEDATHADVWRYLSRPSNAKLREIVMGLARDKNLNPHPPHSELIDNPPYSLAIARIKYWMIPASLPGNDVLALGGYWDKFYNVNPNHGTAEDFAEKFRRFVKKDL